MNMLMQYLYRMFENKGVRGYLINRLYKYSFEEVEFYLPQLTYFPDP
jgi:hypothetical protein